MPEKPTTAYGYIAFGKDGSVTPRIEKLPPEKSEQEIGVGEKFIQLASDLFDERASIQPLGENDHDFNVVVGTKVIAAVQCTEIVYRDFLAASEASTGESILVDGKLCPVDLALRDGVLQQKIEKKLKKNYAKPTDKELWLLIWSVTGYLGFTPSWSASNLVIPESVKRAKAFASENGSGPFDRIMVFNMLTRPTIICPS